MKSGAGAIIAIVAVGAALMTFKNKSEPQKLVELQTSPPGSISYPQPVIPEGGLSKYSPLGISASSLYTGLVSKGIDAPSAKKAAETYGLYTSGIMGVGQYMLYQ